MQGCDAPALLRSLALALFAGTAYASMEWLFFATKPSVVSDLPAPLQFVVLIQSIAALSLLASLALPAAAVAGLSVRPAWVLPWRFLAAVVPALLLSATAFLMFENFTYTLFGLTVFSVLGATRSLYATGFLLLFLAALLRGLQFLGAGALPRRRRRALLAAALSVAAVFVASLIAAGGSGEAEAFSVGEAARKPNIIVLGSDGVLANHLSAYGYSRPTSPAIADWMKDALVVENAFANANKTHGSLGALLSGRWPMRTGVFFYPQHFEGNDARRHLPGLLRQLGYSTAFFGSILYGDPLHLNLKHGFQQLSGGRRENLSTAPDRLERAGLIHPSTTIFLQESVERFLLRIRHSLGIMTMDNPHVVVTQPVSSPDDGLYEELIDFLRSAPEPFLVHVHFLGTHGPTYRPATQVFSKGLDQNRPRMVEFYNDAILEFDTRFGSILREIEARGIAGRSIVALYSDHGNRKHAGERVPLAIRFPDGEHAGRMSANAQLLDLAPTMITYLGLESPPWMDGRSLVASPPRSPKDPIFVADIETQHGKNVGNGMQLRRFNSVTAIYCDRMYTLHLDSRRLEESAIKDHTAPCEGGIVANGGEAKNSILRKLAEIGVGPESLRPQLAPKG